MKQIPLDKGLFALVDDEDFEAINKYKWYADPIGHTHYAKRRIIVDGKGKRNPL